MPNDEQLIDYALGFVPDAGQIDWDDLFLRIEQAFDIDLPEDYLDPMIKRMKKLILAARREQ